jgi:hypothetical protein
MTRRDGVIQRLAPGLAILIGVIAVLAFMQSWPRWQASRLADSWRDQLESADEGRVPPLVEQLVDLGDAGLDRVVSSLGSPRQIVRRQAAAALGRLADNWEISDISARSSSAGRLAALLADRAETFPADARDDAAALVEQMLVWTTDDAYVDRSRFVADCERVLLAADVDRAESARESAVVRRDEHTARRPVADQDLSTLAQLPGGGLVIEPSQAPPLPRVEAPAEPATTRDPREPRLLLDGRGEELPPAPFPFVDPAAATKGAPVRSDRNNPAPTTNNLRATASENRSTRGSVNSLAAAEEPAALAPRTPRERALVRLLGGEPSVARDAEAQLRKLGYTDDALAAARQAASSDPRERLRFVEALGESRTADARAWFTMMLDDEHAPVRLAAFVRLATSGDAALVESLRKRAQFDPDPDIRRQANRLQRSNR